MTSTQARNMTASVFGRNTFHVRNAAKRFSHRARCVAQTGTLRDTVTSRNSTACSVQFGAKQSMSAAYPRFTAGVK